MRNKLSHYWNQLYGSQSPEFLDKFITEIEGIKCKQGDSNTTDWYKDVVVYSLYVDLFNKDFNGLKNKLDYLQDLGISCLWLLPILQSPMRDAGFDISDYQNIRPELLGMEKQADESDKLAVFREFLKEAHQRGIRVIFDIAINHTSNQHPWYLESRKETGNPYRDYYIWNKDTNLYKETRLLFEGMCPDNWEKEGSWYFFHRFFEFQPDLNYKNPKVLLEMTRNFLFWVRQGVDGFRADAIPYLWKEEGTDCENLLQTHTIVKFFRAVLDFVNPGVLLLAEACQPPVEVVKYIGSGDECHAGYHFPLMPQMFKAIELQSAEPIINTLDSQVTPSIPESSQWFTFLRCHDELSLEKVYVNEEDRQFIHSHYCHKPEWDFRVGQGISARLSELMKHNPDKIALAFSVMLTLPGTPVIYYGDEFAKLNDEAYYKEQIQLTGKNDTRFLVRGKIDWEQVNNEIGEQGTLSEQVFTKVKRMINVRNLHPAFGRGKLEWVAIKALSGSVHKEILAFYRIYKDEKILIIHNISEQVVKVDLPVSGIRGNDLFGNPIDQELTLKALGFVWIIV